jgi:hypothetical protein
LFVGIEFSGYVRGMKLPPLLLRASYLLLPYYCQPKGLIMLDLSGGSGKLNPQIK